MKNEGQNHRPGIQLDTGDSYEGIDRYTHICTYLTCIYTHIYFLIVLFFVLNKDKDTSSELRHHVEASS